MAVEPVREPSGRSLVSRLRRTADPRPHFVVCGADPLVYTVAEELANAGHRIRLTVIVPVRLRGDVPDLTGLRGVRVIRADRLDERTFRSAGLADAAVLALVMPDDVVNLHAALCAQAVEPDLRLVILFRTTRLGRCGPVVLALSWAAFSHPSRGPGSAAWRRGSGCGPGRSRRGGRRHPGSSARRW